LEGRAWLPVYREEEAGLEDGREAVRAEKLLRPFFPWPKALCKGAAVM
jgi:hypothetical protein